MNTPRVRSGAKVLALVLAAVMGSFLLGACSSTVQNKPQQISYEPAVTSLSGKVSASADGALILTLERPVDVAQSTGIDTPDSPEKNQREIQLIAEGDSLRAILGATGERVQVTGTLSHAATSHHVRPLLLSVQTVQVHP